MMRHQKTLRLPTKGKLHLFFLYLYILKKLVNFNWRIITLQYCDGFCYTSTWISHRCTCVPPSWAPHNLPPHPIPLGCSRTLSSSALLHALNLHWSSISHMVYTWFNAILSNHCTLAFSHRVQKSVLYICVSFAVSHIGLSLPSF